jgi:sirohydrochlorin ferrochelatase
MIIQPAVVLFAHGSLLCDAGRALDSHVQRLSSSGRFSRVEAGYLNYTDPPVEEAVGRCARVGAERIVVIPWFLIPGKFVRVDLPPRLQEAARLYPSVEILVSPPLGPDASFAQLIARAASLGVEQPDWNMLPAEAGRSCGARPTCPNFESEGCRAQRAGEGTGAVDLELWKSRVRGFGEQDSLLVIAHGSPRTETADLVRADSEEAGRLLGTGAVVTAFLDCNEPDIPGGVVEAAGRRPSDRGSIVVVPYFLHGGKHVARDMIALLEEGQNRCGGVPIRVAPHLGELDELTGLAERRVEDALASRGTVTEGVIPGNGPSA